MHKTFDALPQEDAFFFQRAGRRQGSGPETTVDVQVFMGDFYPH